jgi:hypothetical protein
MVKLIPIQFNGIGKVGDFNWMIKQPQYHDVLFLFNENVESFYNGYSGPGAGNAVIRPYRYNNPIRSMSIPTGYINYNEEGWRGGFKRLDDKTKSIIDHAFKLIEEELAKGKINKIYYSAEKDGRLGTSIFKVNKEVIDYIMTKLATIE